MDNEFLPACPIDSITPRADNSRFYSDQERDALEASMRRFGFTEPLVLNPDRSVIHGNLRLEIAKERIGLKTLPVVVLSEQSHSYHLRANRLVESAAWNHEMIEILLPLEEAPIREELRAIGWFDAFVPPAILAQEGALDAYAEEVVARERIGQSQLNFDQAIFVARTRRAMMRYFEDPEHVGKKGESLEYVAADLREFDFSLLPGEAKYRRRDEVKEAVLGTLTALARTIHIDRADDTDEELLASIAAGSLPIPNRNFQQVLKRVLATLTAYTDLDGQTLLPPPQGQG